MTIALATNLMVLASVLILGGTAIFQAFKGSDGWLLTVAIMAVVIAIN